MISAADHPKTLILGIGNVLMGDEGVGVHVARALEGREDLGGAEVVDGGTGGFHLLDYFRQYHRILLVDATLDGKPPGTLTVLRPRFSSDYPPTLTAHDIGLKDLLDAVQLLEYRPEVILFAISIQGVDRSGTEPTREILDTLPKIVESILEFLT